MKTWIVTNERKQELIVKAEKISDIPTGFGYDDEQPTKVTAARIVDVYTVEDTERKPKEIKEIMSGLECCSGHFEGQACDDCPYESLGGSHCNEELAYDALQFITKFIYPNQADVE